MELAHHEWITLMQREDESESENRYQMVHDLAVFKEATTFQSNVIYFLSGLKLSQEENERIKGSFVKIDTNADGYISKEEARESFDRLKKECLTVAELNEDFEQTWELLDNDYSGTISYNEFVGAVTNKVALLSDANLKIAFNMLDKNGDGTL